MSRTIVNFSLPFAAIDEGEYELKLGERLYRISITHIQNHCGLKELLEMGVEEGKVIVEYDAYGIANYSRVEIQLPYLREDHDEQLINSPSPPSYSLKKDCVVIFNRLIDVVRFETRLHWIPNINEKMIHRYRKRTFDDSDKRIEDVTNFDFGSGIHLSRPSCTQEDAKERIHERLKNGKAIPLHEQLYFDALRYFEEGRTNETVILANTSLEEFVIAYLYTKAFTKFGRDGAEEVLNEIEGAKKFGKILTTHLKKTQNISLDENSDLWQKYNFMRRMRKQAVHPYTRQISVTDAGNVVSYAYEIGDWISFLP
jgi:hypothetical protein